MCSSRCAARRPLSSQCRPRKGNKTRLRNIVPTACPTAVLIPGAQRICDTCVRPRRLTAIYILYKRAFCIYFTGTDRGEVEDVNNCRRGCERRRCDMTKHIALAVASAAGAALVLFIIRRRRQDAEPFTVLRFRGATRPRAKLPTRAQCPTDFTSHKRLLSVRCHAGVTVLLESCFSRRSQAWFPRSG